MIMMKSIRIHVFYFHLYLRHACLFHDDGAYTDLSKVHLPGLGRSPTGLSVGLVGRIRLAGAFSLCYVLLDCDGQRSGIHRSCSYKPCLCRYYRLF